MICVPCAGAAAPELLPFLGAIILFLLFSIAAAVRVAGPFLLVLAAFVWRFVTGAVMRKDLGQKDEQWFAERKRRPRYRRYVRATGRLLALGALFSLMYYPVVLLCAIAVAGTAYSAGRTYVEVRDLRARELATYEQHARLIRRMRAEVGS
jgi:hypothetical protein